jgi:hypothetical protein
MLYGTADWRDHAFGAAPLEWPYALNDPANNRAIIPLYISYIAAVAALFSLSWP